MGTALEMYSTDYSGHYPANLGMLTPNYLRVLPECPAAGRETYSESYERDPDTYEQLVWASYDERRL